MKHFIIMATMGTAALGSGMMLASHCANPGAGTGSMAPPAVPMTSMGSRLPSLPDHLPAMNDAEHAFTTATQTAAHYSDAAFGSTALKAKQSVDAMRRGTH